MTNSYFDVTFQNLFYLTFNFYLTDDATYQPIQILHLQLQYSLILVIHLSTEKEQFLHFYSTDGSLTSICRLIDMVFILHLKNENSN